MRNIKFTDSAQFQCLEHLREAFLDLYLVHCGIEHCQPSYFIGPSYRDEYIIHFVLEGKGSYTVGGITYFLSSNQMFLIYPGEEVRYSSDADEPWTYAWIGFNGIRAASTIKNCGFSKQSYVLPFKNQEVIIDYISNILTSTHLSFSNDLKRNAYLLLIFSSLVDNFSRLSVRSSKTGEAPCGGFLFPQKLLRRLIITAKEMLTETEQIFISDFPHDLICVRGSLRLNCYVFHMFPIKYHVQKQNLLIQ